MNIKEVFIFGAGASYASAGAPLGNELVWSYYSDTCLFNQLNPNGSPDLAEENIEFINLSKFFDLVEQEYPELKGTKSRWKEECKRNNIFFAPYDLNKKYYVDEIVRVFQEKGNSEGVELIRRLTFEHIVGATYDKPNSLYVGFVKGLAGKSPEDISIISINFDCLLHKEFKEVQVDFDYLINFNDTRHAHPNSREGGIPLIKLNGSLDWAFCPECKKRALIFYHLHKNSYNGLNCGMTDGCKAKLRPFIFLPHEDKHKKIKRLWNVAKEKLKQADKITIIGYSFPYYDKEIMNLFKECVKSNVILEIVDFEEDSKKTGKKKQKIEKQVKSIFSLESTPKILLSGFQGYIEKGS